MDSTRLANIDVQKKFVCVANCLLDCNAMNFFPIKKNDLSKVSFFMVPQILSKLVRA